MGNSVTCAINCNHRIFATLYTLETCLFKVCKDIFINTLHKDGGADYDNDDDDDDNNNNNNNGYEDDDNNYNQRGVKPDITHTCNTC